MSIEHDSVNDLVCDGGDMPSRVAMSRNAKAGPWIKSPTECPLVLFWHKRSRCSALRLCCAEVSAGGATASSAGADSETPRHQCPGWDLDRAIDFAESRVRVWPMRRSEMTGWRSRRPRGASFLFLTAAVFDESAGNSGVR